jgi:hypothetical protein
MAYTPEQIKRAYYFQGVLEYVILEYETGYGDQGEMPLTEEMAEYLDECFHNLMCYPNAAGRFVELFMKIK